MIFYFSFICVILLALIMFGARLYMNDSIRVGTVLELKSTGERFIVVRNSAEGKPIIISYAKYRRLLDELDREIDLESTLISVPMEKIREHYNIENDNQGRNPKITL